jgi:hypothetical protein
MVLHCIPRVKGCVKLKTVLAQTEWSVRPSYIFWILIRDSLGTRHGYVRCRDWLCLLALVAEGRKIQWVVYVYRLFSVLPYPICVGAPGQLLHS